jgi:hypothetical protein
MHIRFTGTPNAHCITQIGGFSLLRVPFFSVHQQQPSPHQFFSLIFSSLSRSMARRKMKKQKAKSKKQKAKSKKQKSIMKKKKKFGKKPRERKKREKL